MREEHGRDQGREVGGMGQGARTNEEEGKTGALWSTIKLLSFIRGKGGVNGCWEQKHGIPTLTLCRDRFERPCVESR